MNKNIFDKPEFWNLISLIDVAVAFYFMTCHNIEAEIAFFSFAIMFQIHANSIKK